MADQYREDSNQELSAKLSEDFRSAVKVVTVFVGIETVVGLIGNSFVLYVFYSKYRRCTYRQFVLFLAGIDILSCFTTMPGEILTQIHWFDYPYGDVCKIKSFFNVFTVCADALCLLTIAVDRYRNQCAPSGRQLTETNAKHIGFLNLLAAAILAFPCAILWGTETRQQKYDPSILGGVGNVTHVNVTICEKDGRYSHTNRPIDYSVSIECIVSLSLLAMVVLYVKVARRSVDEEQRLLTEVRYDTQDPKVRRNTLIMAILTGIFVITIITYFTLLSLIAGNVLQGLSNSGKAVYFFFFRLYFINHVMNPVVYGILDTEFKDASKAVLSRSSTD